ncbi:MAG: hypothetical protein AAGI53_13295 [Planctomycetota bacterium]
MKLKGINPIEQYVEKAVLAVVAIALLAAVAVQFLFTPNQVDVQGGRSVAPDRVLAELGVQADRLIGQVEDAEPELPEFQTPDLAATLAAGLAVGTDYSLVEREFNVVALGAVEVIDFNDTVDAQGPVVALELPQLVEPTAAGYWVTVDPYFADAHPGLSEYVPEIQPFDTPGVSVQAKVEVASLLEALRASEEGFRPIPRGWWSAGIEIIEVQAERQRLQADGSWGQNERVGDPIWIEDAVGLVRERYQDVADERDSDAITREELFDLVDLARTDPELTSKPRYLRSIAGLPWVPPAEVAERNERIEARDTADRILEQIAKLEERIADVRARGSNRPAAPPRPSSNPGRSNRPTRPDPGTSTSSVDRIIAGIEEDIAELNEQLEALPLDEDDLQQSRQRQRPRTPRQPATDPAGSTGVWTSPGMIQRNDPGTAARPRPNRRPSASRNAAGGEGLLDQESADVWTHDLDVVPGATYRYRLRIGVNNPLFERGQLLGTDDPEALRAAESALAFTPWTDWTEPAEVDRKSYYFVTSGNDVSLGRSAPSATVELYQMFYGYYRLATESVEPGDPLQARFRLPESLFTFDTEEMVPEDVVAFLEELPNELDEEEDDEGPEIPDGVEQMDTRLALGLEAVLLDVAPRPVNDTGDGLVDEVVTEVFFFDPLEGIVIRDPDIDKKAPRYDRVRRSAKAGETAEILPPEPEPEP